jgi:hypothetical protein
LSSVRPPMPAHGHASARERSREMPGTPCAATQRPSLAHRAVGFRPCSQSPGELSTHLHAAAAATEHRRTTDPRDALGERIQGRRVGGHGDIGVPSGRNKSKQKQHAQHAIPPPPHRQGFRTRWQRRSTRCHQPSSRLPAQRMRQGRKAINQWHTTPCHFTTGLATPGVRRGGGGEQHAKHSERQRSKKRTTPGVPTHRTSPGPLESSWPARTSRAVWVPRRPAPPGVLPASAAGWCHRTLTRTPPWYKRVHRHTREHASTVMQACTCTRRHPPACALLQPRCVFSIVHALLGGRRRRANVHSKHMVAPLATCSRGEWVGWGWGRVCRHSQRSAP